MPSTEVRTIRVINESKGDKEVVALAKRYGQLNKSVGRASKSLSRLSSIVTSFGAFFGFREVVRAADTFQLLEDRIAVFTGSTEKARGVIGELADQARFTKSSLETFADGFNRIAVATSDLGFSTDKVIDITTALQQTLRLSGASAQEANSVFLQFSQALSLSRLQGQELRAVLLGNATLAKLLAKEFQVNVGALKELGEQGRLTSDRVLKALLDNFENLNERASKLRITIGQGLTVALDQIRLKISDLNQEFGIGEGIVKTIDFVIRNFETLTRVLATLIAARYFTKIAIAIKNLDITFKASAFLKFITTNKITLAITSLTILASVFERLYNPPKRTSGAISDELKEVQKQIVELEKRNPSEVFDKSFKRLGRDVIPIVTTVSDKIRQLRLRQKNLNDELKDAKGVKITKQELQKLGGEYDSNAKKLSEFQRFVKRLNLELDNGLITISQYRDAITDFKIGEINDQFKDGILTLDQFNQKLGELVIQLERLSFTDSILVGLATGFQQFADSTKTLAFDIASATNNALGNLENAFVDLARTGKLSFKNLTDSIIADLARIAARRTITQPLAQGLFSALSGGGSGGGTEVIGRTTLADPSLRAAANGAVMMNGRMTAFASGGVVSRPTIFPMANGTGLMGEAGPEAIMPLVRRNGVLGVQGGGGGAIINIINNSGADIQTQERENGGQQEIDIIVSRVVNEGIGNGRFDRTFRESFNLRRQGR